MALHVVILAAGMGKRMYSQTPKVLHQVGGISMLDRVVHAAQLLNPTEIHVIVGHESERVKQSVQSRHIHCIDQPIQLGTGHAVLQALPFIPDEATVLVLYADVPLILTSTLESLLDLSVTSNALGLLVAKLVNPFGLGRIIRDDHHQICLIVEEKDASPAQQLIQEVYSGICCTKAMHLKKWLPRVSNKNVQQEYYLTDIVKMAVQENISIVSHEVTDPYEIQGVNDKLQLQQVERAWQYRVATKLMLAGVTLLDAQRFDVRGDLNCGSDVVIDVNNVFSGAVTLGDRTLIEPNCLLKNVTIGKNCKIFANSVLEDCMIGDNAHVGPFARIRPGTQLADNCKIGNFVEAKNATFGPHSKASHLSYLGDVTVGSDVNIGAGTITCNYDGANKHHTIIEDGVHIGSDTQLVAPVKIGKNATIGAGSTIRKNVPSEELTLTVSDQKTIYGWKRPKKKGADLTS